MAELSARTGATRRDTAVDVDGGIATLAVHASKASWAIRHRALGTVLGLLYLFPIIAAVAGSADVSRHIQQVGPMTAGLAVEATTGLGALPISPWAGLSVLAAWTAAALLLGGLRLRLQDA